MTEHGEVQFATIGEQLPPFSRITTLANWNRFAAVNEEFISFHMDDDAARAAGNEPGAFGMGNLRLSYVMNMLRAWCDDRGDIRSVSLSYRALNQKGDELTATGTVTDIVRADGSTLVTIDIDVVNQDGDSTAPGVANVEFRDAPTG